MAGQENQQYTVLYGRLSQEDERAGESNSIQHQRTLLEKYAKEKGFENTIFLADDGYSGTNFERPSWKKIVEMIEAGQVANLIVKDASRLGREYLQVGYYMEIYFPQKNVRFIAVNDGVDSTVESSNDFNPIRNWANELHAKDTSRKVRAVMKMKAEQGERLGGRPPYGYRKSDGDANTLVPDEDTAPVVKRIFSLCAAGNGPKRIATILTKEQVVNPSNAYYRKTGKSHRGLDTTRPCLWSSNSVTSILNNEVYLGHSVGLRTTTISYKNKQRVERPESERFVVKNTHEALVTQEQWDIVQEVRQHKKRVPKHMDEPNIFSGLVFCADCGKPLVLHRASTMKRTEYNFKCYTYGKKGKTVCTPHHIREFELKAVVLEDLRRVTHFARMKEKQFAAYISSKNTLELRREMNTIQKDLDTMRRRREELSKLFKRLYEDNVLGRVTDEQYRMLAGDYTVEQKALEEQIPEKEARLEKLKADEKKDDVVTFEELGVDSLMVDEAHYFKNAMVTTKMTRVAGISQTESQKASDMYMKCMYMDELTGGHGIVFATGTPISNSMTEMYIMMRYLQYGLLEQKGLLNFDAWASTFGESVTAIELAPEGNGYRSKTRFAKFYNLPELMNMFKQCADIQTADMLKLPVPEITGGKPTIVKLPPSELQRQMVAALGERAEAVRNRLVAPNEDNMLRITNDGRKLALDQRLMNPLLPDDPDSKANACVERVFTIWEKTKAQRSTQMIFCDLSTPRADGFDVYNDIRDKLVARGIPKDEVQFIHDADTEAKKAELFGKVRSGAVRVLMGSTQKMGAGTNVQTRLCALHHLDCPWRPADIAQRNGRMVRQGNMNKEVSIFIYITEATFDAYSYQLVENKQKFISQIMTSKSPARSCEDLDEAALSYAEVKALAAGNPMIKEKMDLDIQVARLRTLKAAYNSQHYRLEDAVTGTFPREIRGTECRIQAFEKDVQTAKDSQSYDKDGKLAFSIELDGKVYDKREDAGKALLGLVGAAVRADHPVSVGHYAGFEVTVAYVPLSKVFVAHLVGEATHTTELGSDAAGNIVRLQNVVAALPQEVSGLRNSLQQLRVQLDSAKEELQQPFLQEQELNEKSARLAELDALLNVGNDAPVLEGEAEVLNEDDSVRTPREENELER
mgnify:CR=1 FL=1